MSGIEVEDESASTGDGPEANDECESEVWLSGCPRRRARSATGGDGGMEYRWSRLSRGEGVWRLSDIKDENDE